MFATDQERGETPASAHQAVELDVQNTRWGATPEEWSAFAAIDGMLARMLPVVANPTAAISPGSTMKALGKTPSIFNSDGKVVGIAKWTQRAPATPAGPGSDCPSSSTCAPTTAVMSTCGPAWGRAPRSRSGFPS